MQGTTPENPHLTDIFRTAMRQASDETPAPLTTEPRIVVSGNNNIVILGGSVVIHDRTRERRRK